MLGTLGALYEYLSMFDYSVHLTPVCLCGPEYASARRSPPRARGNGDGTVDRSVDEGVAAVVLETGWPTGGEQCGALEIKCEALHPLKVDVSEPKRRSKG